jgi:AcrR family transcriptional regulator
MWTICTSTVQSVHTKPEGVLTLRRIRLIVSRVGVPKDTEILEASKRCCERWGMRKVSIDDVAAEAGVSRATLYRMYPGGRDVMFEAMRVRELELFFDRLRDEIAAATSLEDLLVTTVVAATRELRNDEHLATMLASEPGEVIGEITVDGLPRIIRIASAFIAPLAEPYLDREAARAAVDLLTRLTLSYFLAPSEFVDLGDRESARTFLAPFIQPILTPA